MSFNGSITPCGSNLYTSPNMEIIYPSGNDLDLCIYMSGEYTFNFPISSLYTKYALEKIQRSFTKHITGMYDIPYHERLKSLGVYTLQRRRETSCIIYIWSIVEGLAPNFFTLLQVYFLNVEAGHASFPMSM